MNLIELQHALRQLRLGGIAAVLETRLHQAQAETMAPIDLISCLVADELTRRGDRLLERRRKQAAFRDPQQDPGQLRLHLQSEDESQPGLRPGHRAPSSASAKMHCFSGPAILRHSAPPCYIAEINRYSSVGFRPTGPQSSLQPPVSSPISANIGMDGPLAAVRFRGRRFARATSCTTSADSIASIGISHGAHGTT